RDIYLLDDPLSAVDSHVAAQIFKNVIGNRGLLSNKTRIFVTNTLVGLQEVDCIYVLNDGVIAERGTYSERISTGTIFKTLLQIIASYKNDKVSDKSKPASAHSAEFSASIDKSLVEQPLYHHNHHTVLEKFTSESFSSPPTPERKG